MANEIKFFFPTAALNMYAQIVRASDGKFWNGATFETFAAGNWTTYAVTMTSQGAGIYFANWPAALTTEGAYDVMVYQRTGGSPATTDVRVSGAGRMNWSGSAEVDVLTIFTPAEAAGRPTTLLGMIRRAFEWKANKRTRNRNTGAVLLRSDGDSSTLETQTQSTSGSTDSQTQGA